MGLFDEALECMPLSEATIQTMALALGDFLRLIISNELLFQRTYFDCIPGKFIALVSNDDEQRQQALEFCRRSLKQWKSSRSWSTLTGTQESCTTPSCGPWPPGHVRFFWRFTSATSTVFLVQLALACTRSLPSVSVVLGVVMEHRTLVQRSSESVQREPHSPIEQPGYVAQGSQLPCCGGLWESTLGCAA